MRRAVDIILPPRCLLSGKIVQEQGMIDPKSWAELVFINDPFCVVCGIPFDYETEGASHCGKCLERAPDYDSARAAVTYNDISKKLILGFKHGDQLHAVLCFTPWLHNAGAQQIQNIDVMVPVPLHRMRLITRKYNQAAILVQALSKTCKKPMALEGLKRVKNTVSQGHMRSGERAKNVKSAFIVPDQSREQIAGKSVLLVDDVYTTGATVNECARVLKRAGAAQVHILTIARVIKE